MGPRFKLALRGSDGEKIDSSNKYSKSLHMQLPNEIQSLRLKVPWSDRISSKKVKTNGRKEDPHDPKWAKLTVVWLNTLKNARKEKFYDPEMLPPHVERRLRKHEHGGQVPFWLLS